MLDIKDLHVDIEGKEILKGVSLRIKKGEVHALMGPNGSGKSTLSMALMGHPKYNVSKGETRIEDKSLLDLSVDERAKAGLFLSFQYPSSVSGVSVANFLRTAYNKTHERIAVTDFMKSLYSAMDVLEMDRSFAQRHLNVGFSGGEKKRAEMLQMLVLKPKFIILDETDSGLDVDALKLVSKAINLAKKGSGVLLITHYQRILHYVKPDFVHILKQGKITQSGTYELAEHVEKNGYN